MVEGYSRELSSCGFFPGGGDEGAFYAYAYPEPDGFADHPVGPEEAGYDKDLGEYLLPYEAVRQAADPDQALLGFLQDTYEAARCMPAGTAPRSKTTPIAGRRIKPAHERGVSVPSVLQRPLCGPARTRRRVCGWPHVRRVNHERGVSLPRA